MEHKGAYIGKDTADISKAKLTIVVGAIATNALMVDIPLASTEWLLRVQPRDNGIAIQKWIGTFDNFCRTAKISDACVESPKQQKRADVKSFSGFTTKKEHATMPPTVLPCGNATNILWV